LQTPITFAEFRKAGESFLAEMKRLLLSTDWNRETETAGTTLESRSMPNSNVQMIRYTRTFDDVGKFHDFVEELYDSSLEKKQEIYVDMLENKMLHHVDDNNHVVLSQFKAPFPTTNREFVMLKSRDVLDDGSHLITSRSINFAEVPFSSGFVRGAGKTGMLITPLHTEDKIRVTKIDYVNPKGWIPSFILNWVKGKSIENIDKMEGYL
jgi:hypothetical protein